MDEQATTTQQTEIIRTLSTSEIILKVTEILPPDVFYSPLHKVVVKRQRKRKRVETPELPPGNVPMDIFWRDIPFNPTALANGLSQFMGEYAMSTMEKDTQFYTLLREKEERIARLEQQLETEKASVNRQAAQ